MCGCVGCDLCFARLNKLLPGFFVDRWSEMFDKQASSSSNACSSFLIVILVHSLSVLDKCVILVCSM